MKSRLNIITIVHALSTAAYAAMALAFLTLYYFRLSGEQVRGAATIVAILIAAFVAIDFYGKKLRSSD